MPARPAKACRVFGCGNLAPCPVHYRPPVRLRRSPYPDDRDPRRGSAAKRGYDRRWTRFTVWYFGELMRLRVARAGQCGCRHPLAQATDDSACAAAGVVKMATLVDHITPITGKGDPNFYDLANLQGLCDRCHNQKRQRESEQAKHRRP